MSATWVSGGQVSARLVERHLASMLLRSTQEQHAQRAARRCARAWRAAGQTLGPASGATAVWMHLVQPCADACGWRPGESRPEAIGALPVRVAEGRLGSAPMLLVATPWGLQQDGLQRACVRLGVQFRAQWVSVCNGMSWRWYDVTRPYARDHVALDLTRAGGDARVWHVLWLLGQPSGVAPCAREAGTVVLERLGTSSAVHMAAAANSLRVGVARALEHLTHVLGGGVDTHVTQIFQWLFLLFAEARELRPVWHPVYRRSYALTTLLHEGARPRAPLGMHESLVAIGRAGRDGVTSPRLHLSALNGPLFADGALARLPRGRVPDADLSFVLDLLVHGPGSTRTHAIDFSELGVEHLGTIYEHLMSPPPPPSPSVARVVGRSSPGPRQPPVNGPRTAGAPLLRKRTGAFYTPRTLADLLVQRTLDPLVRAATGDQILALRILDPAMGSGALLAGAVRYLTAAVEAAWVREGRGGLLDVPRDERDDLPRRVVEQCLYGVDVNERAVQVARLSLWLLSLSPDRPLTWLDAHLRVGSSLVGASPALLLARSPVRDRVSRRADGQPTLFELTHWHHEADRLGSALRELSARPTVTADDARMKSRTLAALRRGGVLATWRTRADLWCGAAMDVTSAAPALWRAVDSEVRSGGRDVILPSRATQALRARWQALADAQPCLHWGLEFPDVFDAGCGGFDAVLANPPWEMLRGDLGSAEDRSARRHDVEPLLRFVRRSGVYRQAGGHINSYQLFLERMLQLVRPGGRCGCLLPGSMLADHGAGPLRRHLFDHADVDRLSVFDNREALFPIHRSMRIVSLAATVGATTATLLLDEGQPLRLGSGRADAGEPPRLLTRQLLRRAGGEREPVPAVRSSGDLAILQRVLGAPQLGDQGWGLRFGRELNATEDRGILRSTSEAGACIVVDGRHVRPFVVRPPAAGPWVTRGDAQRALPDESWSRWRLAYRDVSSATNTRSLIVALLPPGCVSTHTLFCLRGRVSLRVQLYLCGVMNSLVADWFVRLYLGSHVTTGLVARLPVPRPPVTSPHRRAIVTLTHALMRQPADEGAAAELQARAAILYGVTAEQLAAVADTFARLPPTLRTGMLAAHARLTAGDVETRSATNGNPHGGGENGQDAQA